MMNIVEHEREFCGKEEGEEEEEEEEDDDEEEQMIISSTSKLPLISPSSCTAKHTDFQPQNHLNLWTPSSDHSQLQGYRTQESPSSSLNSDKRLDLMDLSLGSENRTFQSASTSTATSEREHMFDKVVTPSDVGKLNRLVIPKQHAEKYFPLDSSSNEKGLLLNFEDRNGKPWRFRYSYWNSSQSYVMTKGWSRFVKEKKLDAGDIVSFQRGVGESGKHHLYIDWRRRPNAPDPTSFAQLELQNQLHFSQSSSLRWGTVYSLPHTLSSSMPPPRFPYHHQSQFRIFNYGHQQQQYLSATRYGFPTDVFRPPVPPPPMHQQQQEGHQGSMVMDSIPVVHGRSVGKRLRLFGVNMECPTQDDNSPDGLPAYLASQQSRLASSSNDSTPTSSQADTHHEFSKKGKTSLSFDLGL